MEKPDYEQAPPTQSFAAFQPGPQPAPAVQQPDQRLFTPPPRRRSRVPIVLAVVFGIVVAVAGGVVAGLTIGRGGGQNALPQRLSIAAQTTTKAPSPAPTVTPVNSGGIAGLGGGSDVDLRRGGVFVMSNDPTGNQVVAFGRKDDGSLFEVGRYSTGGVGSGHFQDSAHGIVLGSSSGETSPQQNLDRVELLYVLNAGSGSITVFRVDADGLELVDTVPTGGLDPVSLTVNRGLVYVLNSGALDDRFILHFPDQFLDNCTSGEPPTVTGFRVSLDGHLTAIPNSTRPLGGSQESGCAQVSFTPDGTHLMVTERLASLLQTDPGRGDIVSFVVNSDGTLGAKNVINPGGVGPFGFAFTKNDTMVLTYQYHSMDGQGAAGSYTVLPDGTLKEISKSVPDMVSDTCWIVPTNDGHMAFTASALGGGAISSYRIDDTGALTLLHSKATTDSRIMNGTSDLALSNDSNYLYQLNSHFGLLQVLRVNSDGTLGFLQQIKVFNVTLPENGGQLPPFGISAF